MSSTNEFSDDQIKNISCTWMYLSFEIVVTFSVGLIEREICAFEVFSNFTNKQQILDVDVAVKETLSDLYESDADH